MSLYPPGHTPEPDMGWEEAGELMTQEERDASPGFALIADLDGEGLLTVLPVELERDRNGDKAWVAEESRAIIRAAMALQQTVERWTLDAGHAHRSDAYDQAKALRRRLDALVEDLV